MIVSFFLANIILIPLLYKTTKEFSILVPVTPEFYGRWETETESGTECITILPSGNIYIDTKSMSGVENHRETYVTAFGQDPAVQNQNKLCIRSDTEFVFQGKPQKVNGVLQVVINNQVYKNIFHNKQ